MHCAVSAVVHCAKRIRRSDGSGDQNRDRIAALRAAAGLSFRHFEVLDSKSLAGEEPTRATVDMGQQHL